MKKWISLLLCALLALDCLSPAALAQEEKKTLNVVVTIFPIYDWVREVAGDDEHLNLTLLLNNGVDLHSYQPTVSDMMDIATCDVFIYVGGESDRWVTDALSGEVNPDMVVVNLMDVLGDAVKTEEIVEGMEHDHDHEHEDEDEDHGREDGDEDGDHDHEEDEEPDEHIWLSLKNAQVLVQAIADAFAQVDPGCAEDYAARAAAYDEQLSALDAEYAAAVEGAQVDTLLFGDRFPFRYLVDDYGLSYYAAFAGCSAETEASFKTVVFLAGKVDELNLPAVLTIEGGDGRIAQTVVEATKARDARVLTLDSMQATTARDIEGGVRYLDVMRKNLEVLRQALNR